jgi:DNA-binding NarL/FixJ family response regulator
MSESIRILLADDHPLFREGVANSLAATSDFAIIAQAGSGEEAVQLTRALKPDMVLLDVSMPGMGGIAAAAQIATDLPQVRIMMLTVSETPESLLAALKAGAHGYVLKGVSASELRSIVRNVAMGDAYVTPSLAAEMLTEFSRPRPPDAFETLTARETGVLELLSQGLTNREIGERLHLSEKTVKHHMTIILQKLQVRSRTEAALMAVQHGVTPRSEHR